MEMSSSRLRVVVLSVLALIPLSGYSCIKGEYYGETTAVLYDVDAECEKTSRVLLGPTWGSVRAHLNQSFDRVSGLAFLDLPPLNEMAFTVGGYNRQNGQLVHLNGNVCIVDVCADVFLWGTARDENGDGIVDVIQTGNQPDDAYALQYDRDYNCTGYIQIAPFAVERVQ
jgi:hypothetical protein